jgi:hypothetical protein
VQERCNAVNDRVHDYLEDPIPAALRTTAVFVAGVDEPATPQALLKSGAIGESVSLEPKGLDLAFEALSANSPSPFADDPP